MSGEGARGEKGPGVGHPSAALRGRACGTTMSALRGPFQMREQPAHEAGFVFAGELVFPKTEDAPAERAEGAGDEAVAGAVGGKLLRQKAALVLGDVAWSGQPCQKQPSTKVVYCFRRQLPAAAFAEAKERVTAMNRRRKFSVFSGQSLRFPVDAVLPDLKFVAAHRAKWASLSG